LAGFVLLADGFRSARAGFGAAILPPCSAGSLARNRCRNAAQTPRACRIRAGRRGHRRPTGAGFRRRQMLAEDAFCALRHRVAKNRGFSGRGGRG
jgi:hypothetical protein